MFTCMWQNEENSSKGKKIFIEDKLFKKNILVRTNEEEFKSQIKIRGFFKLLSIDKNYLCNKNKQNYYCRTFHYFYFNNFYRKTIKDM